eukprot:Nk52_evm1s2616 gene=Nk52_evmTU1s2616
MVVAGFLTKAAAVGRGITAGRRGMVISPRWQVLHRHLSSATTTTSSYQGCTVDIRPPITAMPASPEYDPTPVSTVHREYERQYQEGMRGLRRAAMEQLLVRKKAKGEIEEEWRGRVEERRYAKEARLVERQQSVEKVEKMATTLSEEEKEEKRARARAAYERMEGMRATRRAQLKSKAMDLVGSGAVVKEEEKMEEEEEEDNVISMKKKMREQGIITREMLDDVIAHALDNPARPESLLDPPGKVLARRR